MMAKPGRSTARFLNPQKACGRKSKRSDSCGELLSAGCRLALKCRHQYLLCQSLCVIQTLCERLNNNIAAALAQAIVLSTFLAGLGQQSHPNLGHRVTAGLLPDHT